MTLREFTPDDIEELVHMMYDKVIETYPNRKIGSLYYFYRKAISTIESHAKVILAESDGDIAGFMITRVTDNDGLTESTHVGEAIYVKPKYRKSKAAMLMTKFAKSISNELGLPSMITVTVDTQSMYDRYDMKPILTIMEG